MPVILSRKNERNISPAVGDEFLYDYITKTLDTERSQALSRLVSESAHVREEIKKIESAMSYAEELSKTDVAPVLLERVGTPTSYVQGFLQKVKFQQWPSGIKLGLEVMTITSLVVGTALIIPWHRLLNISWTRKDIILAEIQNEYKKQSSSENLIAKTELPLNKDAEFKDEHLKGEGAATPTPAPEKISVVVPVVVPSAQPPAKAPAPEKPSAPVVATKVETTKESSDGKSQGWLHRGTIAVVNLAPTTDKFVKKITELGGRKAGEVELGWKKPEGSYFHFTIPESRSEELKKFFAEYGTLKLQKEKHERVMPDGIIRLIITVSEAKKK